MHCLHPCGGECGGKTKKHWVVNVVHNDKQKKGVIVPFRQDHEFFYSRAVKYIDRDNAQQGAYYAARAAMLDDSDLECRMELAGAYADLGRFVRSNELLFSLLSDEYDGQAACWYEIGCNFAALQQYGYAREALRRCIAIQPDSQWAQDAQDVLEPIDEYCQGDDRDRTTWYLHHRVMEARALLQQGALEQAERLFAQLDAIEPLFMDVRNDYARTLFQRGKQERAVQLCSWVLQRYPNDIMALCLLAQFYMQMQKKQEAQQVLERVCALRFERDMESCDDLVEVARTLYRAGMYQEAQTRLEKMLRMEPGGEEGMHLLAACQYMQKHYDAAAQIWRDMSRIDPEDIVSEYYLHHCLRLKNGTARIKRVIPDRFSLPSSEYMRRMVRINKVLEDIPAARQKWTDQRELHALIRWGCGQAPLRKTMSVFLCMMGDARAARMLRAMLLLPVESEAFKRHVCAALKTMHAPEPYYVGLNDTLVVMHVQRRKTQPDAVVQLACRQLEQQGMQDTEPALRKIWQTFMQSAADTSDVAASTQAYAAALEYWYRMQIGARTLKTPILRRYDVGLSAFNRALAKLSDALLKRQTQKEE